MGPRTKAKAHQASEVALKLAELLEVSAEKVRTIPLEGRGGPDLLVEAGERRFLVEFKSSGAAAPVLTGLLQLSEYRDRLTSDAIPLLVVPFMGEIGRKYCRNQGVSWLDLSGNAEIRAPGLKILVEGRENRFKSVGKPANLFAPASSRIARLLLVHPDKGFTQRAIAHETSLDEGFTSRLIHKLEEEKFIERNSQGAVRVTDPELLLNAWIERYSFQDHQVVRGHVPARSGEELLKLVSDYLTARKIHFATTGLSAAWLFNRFAGFRIATFYVDPSLPTDLEKGLGFRAEARGANVWFVVPQDSGVFYAESIRDAIPCVHPVQVYLDLKAHPERASEAAEQLKSEFLKWRRNGS